MRGGRNNSQSPYSCGYSYLSYLLSLLVLLCRSERSFDERIEKVDVVRRVLLFADKPAQKSSNTATRRLCTCCRRHTVATAHSLNLLIGELRQPLYLVISDPVVRAASNFLISD